MEDDVRAKLLPIPEKEMLRLAQICNRYPFVQVEWEFQDVSSKSVEFEAGDTINLVVTVTRDDDDEEESEPDPEALAVFNSPVNAQFYPTKKFEEWWVIIGHQASGKLLAIKKISNFRAQKAVKTALQFVVGGGDFIKDGVSIADLKLFLMCDSYVGCDL